MGRDCKGISRLPRSLFYLIKSAVLKVVQASHYNPWFKELLAYISLYLVINLTYRLVLVRNSSCDIEFQSCVRWKQYRETFESLRGYCYENVKSIPLMFVLGFYVSLVVTRYVFMNMM